MKELTIAQKAARYDEAIERARKIENGVPIDVPDGTHIPVAIFPELKESEDENIRKKLIENFKWFCGDYPETSKWGKDDDLLVKDIIAWLEKQTHDGKKWMYEDVYLKEKEQLIQDGIDEVLENPQKYGLERLGEQKPLDRLEPKFRQGDWIVDDCGFVWEIKGILKKSCLLESVEGCESFPSIEWVNKNFHSWTIADAKDGDVLVASDGSIFIFAGVVDCACKYYVSALTDGFIKINKEKEGGYWETSRAVYPATKEQRDTLFAKMKEEGYEWNAEKKEIEKIEQNHVWSEEDEKFTHGLIRGLTAQRDIHGHITFSSDCIDITETIHWLEILKDRVRIQPQNKWKPSDRQMESLEHFVRSIGESGYASPYDDNTKLLYSLLEDLKELKG